jgi:hypothetical protein
MNRWLPFLALALFHPLISVFADLSVGQTYRISFTDLNGNNLSTADGHITTVALVSKANVDKAHALGDRTPDLCLGNPSYRMLTIVAFEMEHTRPMRAFIMSIMRRRVNSEAHRLQDRYNQLKVARDARKDVFAVADFDGAIAAKFDSKPSATLFRVFAFGKNGELLKQWDDLPSAEELTAALKPSD